VSDRLNSPILDRTAWGRFSDYHRGVAVDVETSIDIGCPPTVVAAYVSNPDNATKWYVNIKSVDWKTPRPAGVGSRVAFIAQFLGRRIVYTHEVLDVVLGERFVMSTAEGPFPIKTTYTWHDAPNGGTRMTLRNEGGPSGFAKVASPVMEAAMRRANQKDLARLKRILEARK
jgi:Polyketide cyclase / dehydrase and lipid transport